VDGVARYEGGKERRKKGIINERKKEEKTEKTKRKD
jgi:hypothetical protein